MDGIGRVSTPQLTYKSAHTLSAGENRKTEQDKDSFCLRKRPLAEIMDQNRLRQLMHEIPKVDLHRHLEGAIEPETFVAIAEKKGIKLPSYDIEELRPKLQVTDKDKTLLDFLSKFETIGLAFTDKEAVQEITYQAVHDCKKDNVNYVELRFSPTYMAEQYGMKEEDVMQGVLDGIREAKKDNGIETGLIMIVERQRGPAHAEHISKMAQAYMKDGVVGLDLANDEYNYPPGPYAEVFQDAKAAGLNITVHAGEAGGAENVKTSITQLKADRIGHGVRTFQDPEVEKLVKEKGITLEMCPTSNVQTGATDSLDNHPLKKYYDDGIKVTINTDDPGVSNIDLTNEYQEVVNQFGFTMEDVEQFVMNGIDSAFLPKEEKEAMRTKYMKEFQTITEKYLIAE